MILIAVKVRQQTPHTAKHHLFDQMAKRLPAHHNAENVKFTWISLSDICTISKHRFQSATDCISSLGIQGWGGGTNLSMRCPCDVTRTTVQVAI